MVAKGGGGLGRVDLDDVLRIGDGDEGGDPSFADGSTGKDLHVIEI